CLSASSNSREGCYVRTVSLYASRSSPIGKTAHWRDHSVSGERVLVGENARRGAERDWMKDLLDDAGLPIVGLVWEVSRAVATVQRFEMYEGDSLSILVQAGDIPL